MRSRKLEFRLGRGFDDLIVGRQQKLVSGEQRRRHRWWSLGGSFIDLACRYGLVFFMGGVFAVLGWQPMKFMLRGLADAVIMFKESTQNRPDLAIPIRYDGNGVVVFDKARASKGLTVVQELLSGGPQLRLIDMEGHEIHRWKLDFATIWPHPTHIQPAGNIPKSIMNLHTQGFVTHPDGSVVVAFGSNGAAMLDKCGRALWTVDRMVHHALTSKPGGGYYMLEHVPLDRIPDYLLPAGIGRAEAEKTLVGFGGHPEDAVLDIDSRGKIVNEFPVLQAVHDAGLMPAISDARADRPLDPVHTNDIEMVTQPLAAKIPGVVAGDLLVSLRNMNMLAILDAKTGTLKWHKRGPWVRQHDPDIMPDGIITVFDNADYYLDRAPPRSRILSYDPATGAVEVLHPQGSADRFYTQIMGSHQRLPNGNNLIVETLAGRVFEATPDGDVVWSYVRRYDDEYAAPIEDARRLPANFFTVTDWSCPTKTSGETR